MRFVLTSLVLAGATTLAAGLAAPATAAEPRRCLSPSEQRAAIAVHKVVPIARAIRAIKARYPGDVVRVRLCEQRRRLIYVLTVLPRSGKVVHVAVDAATGAVVGGS